ncbi:SDR family NAD(P)-dependent oxidoreductase [Rhizosaccharibacter radicis]|uniref:SDR family oxidoreductase n=1 Tax=Rhizosaccharibacter radicis TaxID=2782605 RepID=A0ABT1VUS3_9PROT|nr:SDR family oxidoreductase [Acetobacteraceae bacterium KSS12]
MRLANKTAFITGGTSGIGLAAAALFLREGARVVVTGRRPEGLEEARSLLGERGFALAADVTDPDATGRAVADAVARFGALDVLFANAGIPGATPLGNTTLDAFDRIVRTNLHAVFFTVQAALPHLKDGASIILNGSVHAVLGIPGASAYAASKGAISSMARVLASELAPRGIRVNTVVPGATRTPIWKGRAPTPEALEALEARFNRATPLNRFAEAEQVAQAALFLASDESAHTTAAEITVDGGATGAPFGAPAYRTE